VSAREVIIDALGTALVIAALLSLGGCGKEAEPEVVARHEVCTVSFQADGSVECVCEVVK
jgi:hypothetical protein